MLLSGNMQIDITNSVLKFCKMDLTFELQKNCRSILKIIVFRLRNISFSLKFKTFICFKVAKDVFVKRTFAKSTLEKISSRFQL